MNYAKIICLVALLMPLNSHVWGQVPITSVVEHFTNTSCSICAANNGNIYAAINNHPNVLHISFHPSSPYANDFFNQQNQTENDDRTNFYGIYGGTPRVVLNGTPISYNTLNTSLSNAVTTTNYTLRIAQVQATTGNFTVQAVVKKIAQDNLNDALLFVGVVEDTIYQTTNNGEDVHYNVFRKALTSPIGNSLSLPVQVGDSTVVNFSFNAAPSWNTNNLYTFGLIQRTDKILINSVWSDNSAGTITAIETINADKKPSILYPNPVPDSILYPNEDIKGLSIYNPIGQKLCDITTTEKNNPISVKNLPAGMYVAIVETKTKGLITQKIIIK